MCRVILLASVLSLALVSGCTVDDLMTSDPSTWKPGQVLSENVTDMGSGYRQVARSQVNPPDHWEGVGHFVFVYFKNQRLCQCSADEISLSPNGQFAIYANDDGGRLTLFDASTSAIRALTEQYVGFPYSTDWDVVNGRAIVRVKKWESDRNGYQQSERSIELNDGT